MDDNYPVLYVFVNTDLPSMNPGKAQAHSGHAANAFINKAAIQPMRAGKELRHDVQTWMAETPFGFGTQINLKGEWNEVVHAVANAAEAGAVAELVIDPTYPYIVDKEIVKLIDPKVHTKIPYDLEDGRFLCCRQEVTAAYIFYFKNKLEPIVSKFPLHP